MNPIKRSLEEPESTQPVKRRKIDTALVQKRPYSWTPFFDLPYDILNLLFARFTAQNLATFDAICRFHSTQTTSAWQMLREKASFVIDCSVCPPGPENHRMNYLLSQAVVNFIQSLPLKKAYPVKPKSIELFQPVCQQFPLFHSLVELTQLPKEATTIPTDLRQELNKDPLLNTIADIYQSAIELSHLVIRDRNARRNQEIREKREKICQAIKPKIELKITLGATYINRLMLKIFHAYNLTRQSESEYKYNHFFLYLAQKSYEKGDKLIDEKLKTFGINLEERVYSEDDPRHLIKKFIELNQKHFGSIPIEFYSPTYYEVLNSSSHVSYQRVPSFFTEVKDTDPQNLLDLEELQKMWIILQKLVDEKEMPSDLWYAAFILKLRLHDWQGADCVLSKILEKDHQSSPFILWAAAKLKIKLNQWEKAHTFYNQLKKKRIFHKKLCIESVICKIKLNKLKDADKAINGYLKIKEEEKEMQKRMAINGYLKIKEEEMQEGSENTNKITYIDYPLQRLEALRLIYGNADWDKYKQEIQEFLNENLYVQSNYQIPFHCACELAQRHLASEQLKEALDLYDLIAKALPINEWDLSDYSKYLETIYRLERFEEGEQLLQLRTIGIDSGEIVLSLAFFIKYNRKKWQEADSYASLLFECHKSANYARFFLHPIPLQCYLKVAFVKCQREKWEEAASLYQEALNKYQADKFSPASYSQIVFVYNKLGKEQEVYRICKQALQVHGDQNLPAIKNLGEKLGLQIPKKD